MLQPLRSAVNAALVQLQAEQAHEASSDVEAAQVATGSGVALDAWLGVSRLEEVLDRCLELV